MAGKSLTLTQLRQYWALYKKAGYNVAILARDQKGSYSTWNARIAACLRHPGIDTTIPADAPRKLKQKNTARPHAELRAIWAAFLAHDENESAAARALGMARGTLQHALQTCERELGLKREGKGRRGAEYEALRPFATPEQAVLLDAIAAHGSLAAAATALGLLHNTARSRIEAIKRRAAIQGLAPEADMTRPAPPPFVVKGTSTLYDDTGAIRAQWVKTRLDNDQAEQAIRAFVADLAQSAEGKSPLIPAPKANDADLLAVYPMGDPHFGMYAWAAEAGDDFDTDLAERLTMGAIDRLVDSAPPAHTALVLELGDFFHADSSTNRTPNSGATLDVDTRWARVMQIGLRAMVYVIERSLAKHQLVHVRITKGNHDPHASFALALALDAYFRNNERVKVDLSPAVHWYLLFGKVLIGSTHGDTTPMKDLPGVMAADRPEYWGQSVHRYWYAGHVHHVEVKEFHGVTVETFRTLAARDAWHDGKGYRAGRDMRCIVHHRDYGEVERHRCDVSMINTKGAA